MSKVKVPKSTEETRSSRETVSSTPNKGAVVEAQPVGVEDSGVSPEGNSGPETGSIVTQPHPAKGADPVRIQRENKKVTLGRHVHSKGHEVTGPKTAAELKAEDDKKVALFSRGGSGTAAEVPHPGVSGRDFVSDESANPANTQEK